MSGYGSYGGSSSYGSSGSYGDESRVRAEQEQYKNQLQQEQQRAMVQSVIAKLTEVCWEKCVSSTSSKLGSSEKRCIENCAGRYLDSSKFVQSRLSQQQ